MKDDVRLSDGCLPVRKLEGNSARTEFGTSGDMPAIRENVSLAGFSTIGIGGVARYFSEIESVGALIAHVAWARANDLPLFILGGGSNIIVADRGFPGLVLRVKIGGIEARLVEDQAIVTAGAGVEWDALVSMCVERGFAGMECLAGIPGSVGATPLQNVGAYGQEVSETLVSLEALDLTNNQLTVIASSECEFGYRTSRFKVRDRHRFIITSVTFRLAVNGTPAVRYAEMQRYLSEHGSQPVSLSDVRRAVLAIRRRKGMVLDTHDPDTRSVGSFFVNPTVTRKQYEEIRERVLAVNPDSEEMPSYVVSESHIKLSAAWMIERAGFRRGHIHGNVGLSGKHVLAIINRGGGRADEVISLAAEIRAKVMHLFGVALVPEPVFIGFDRETFPPDFRPSTSDEAVA